MTIADQSHTEPPIEQVAELIATAGIAGRPLRELLRELAANHSTLAELIRSQAMPRRTVEELLAAADCDLEQHAQTYHLRGDLIDTYARRFDFAQLDRTAPQDPLAAQIARHTGTVELIADLIERAPRARRDFDHVSATAETVVRRALWLVAHFDLAGARVLFVGDHDLTSLATALVCPGADITVVDIDERVLAFVLDEATKADLRLRCLFADLRLGFPTAAASSADLVVTDPPYTPEGVRLFLARGVEGLRDKDNSRLVLAYGFSPRQPTLGLKVQNTLRELHLTTEMMMPKFNRYLGAQAVGSAADWYSLRPTSKTWKSVADLTAGVRRIYTHGTQSLEATTRDLPTAVSEFVTGLLDDEPVVMIGTGSIDRSPPAAKVNLDTLLSKGIPSAHSRGGTATVVANLIEDQGPWLLRVLLAANCATLYAVVPDNHPDLANPTALDELERLVSAKYELSIIHGAHVDDHAIVHTRAVDSTRADAVHLVSATLLSRAHGKVGNGWREGLIRACAERGLTKRRAGDAVRAAAQHEWQLDVPLIELGRLDIAAVLTSVRTSVALVTASQ